MDDASENLEDDDRMILDMKTAAEGKLPAAHSNAMVHTYIPTHFIFGGNLPASSCFHDLLGSSYNLNDPPTFL